MKTASYGYILKTVQMYNILPVTSSCSSGCVFCSHKNNPVDIEVFNLPRLSFSEICDMAEFLDGSKKIVIGESASRIIEGEPFIREDMLDIIKYLRKKFSRAEIEITTGGSCPT
jgi:molybdenum cofactor biosynthesis enzyme MoaA